MYNALGYGKGDTILAAVAIVIGCPAYASPSLPASLEADMQSFEQTMAVLALRRANTRRERIRTKMNGTLRPVFPH